LEQFYYHRLLNNKKDLYVDISNNEESYFSNSSLNMFSMCEYLSVLPMTGNKKFVCLSNFNNKIDKKYNKIDVYKNGILIRQEEKEITHGGWWHIEVDFEDNSVYKVVNTLWDQNKQNIIKQVVNEFSSLDQLKNNGHFTAK
jgi:hypothetical protein